MALRTLLGSARTIPPFICTTRWPLLSRTRRVGVDEAASNFAPQVDEPVSITPEEVPVLRPGVVEQGRAHG
jgi:hypothetical protein